MIQFSDSDLEQLKERNISKTDFDQYIQYFREGFPSLNLLKNCEVGTEIKRFDEDEQEKYRGIYLGDYDVDVLKFVPASGAASRMFKVLFAYADGKEISDGKEAKDIDKLFTELDQTAFYEQLKENFGMEKLEELRKSDSGRRELSKYILTGQGLGYAEQPKGMVLFHKYDDGSRTAFAEHLAEGSMYARKNDEVRIHYTLPEQNRKEIEDHLQEQVRIFEDKLGGTFEIETSVQKPSTDTPAVTMNNEPYRDEDGSLFFRPAGHGALLENLNDLDADIIFIKNIDNVVPDSSKEITVKYKEILGGYLLYVQKQTFDYLNDIDNGKLHKEDCFQFILDHFSLKLNPNTSDKELYEFLNRPMRVCGMVKNEGEPGGGPFVVENKDGSRSLQIVETAQIDTEDEGQKALLSQASHFNPVDLVCATKDYKGNKFNLMKYREMSTGIITTKSIKGEEIKALELPGLWNGSMHYWLTMFVEVPVETFNPVKTIFDLLRPTHRS